MSIDAKWWDIVQFLPNKTEAKVLAALVRIECGNAYQIWKNSGLKHYPTVLRTLKKLEKKHLVKRLDVSIARGGKTYSRTMQGTLVFFISNDDDKSIVELALKESRLLRELYKVERDDGLAFGATRKVVLESCKGGQAFSFDDAVKDDMEWWIIDCVSDGALNLEPEKLEQLSKISKVRWIRDLIFEQIEYDRQRYAEATKILDAYAKSLQPRKG